MTHQYCPWRGLQVLSFAGLTVKLAKGYKENVIHTPEMRPIMWAEKMNQSVRSTAYTTQPVWFSIMAA